VYNRILKGYHIVKEVVEVADFTVGERFFQETKYGKGRKLPPTRILSKPSFFKTYKDVPVFKLNSPVTIDGPGIWRVIFKRRSIRSYDRDAPLDFDVFSQLVWASCGISSIRDGFSFRTWPSAGALYPIETYIYVNNVEKLQKGIYHYNVMDHSLELISSADYSGPLTSACLGQNMVREASAVFIWAAVIDRCRVKYGERAFRYIFMEVGHICQNLYLTSTACDLACCAIGAFFDDDVNLILGLDGINESTIYIATVGIPKI
jgi:SagB-type dehydrogenase family enzyme